MLILLIFFSYLLLLTKLSHISCLRKNLLVSAVLIGLFTVFSTEVLSLFNSLNKFWVVSAWGCFNLILLSVFLRKKEVLLENVKKYFSFPIINNYYLKILISVIVFYIVISGLIALVAYPNNHDSMTYHLPRIEHWIQNQNINHYPTSNIRQLYSAPFAEYFSLQLKLMGSDERVVNLTQFLSFIFSIIGVSLLAKTSGADKKGQIFVSVVATTVPIAILQSNSTQNDLVTAFWIISFVYFAFEFFKNKENNLIFHSFLTGASLGLALLSKGTAYIFTLPFLVCFLILVFKKHKSEAFKYLLIAGLTGLLINISFYSRNLDLFGNPLCPQSHSQNMFFNQEYNVKTFISGVIRNISLHLATPVNHLNEQIVQKINGFHNLLAIDINNPATTFPNSKFSISKGIIHEDLAGNFFHLLLITISAFLVFSKTGQRNKFIYLYTGCTIISFLLFCFLLKWQITGVRLHLPFFILSAPLVGTALGSKKLYKTGYFISLLLILTALPMLFCNYKRPIINIMNPDNFLDNIFTRNKYEQYFYSKSRGYLKEDFINIAKLIKEENCKSIGYEGNPNSYDYPFFPLLKDSPGINFKLNYIFVNNISGILIKKDEFREFSPDCIISINKARPEVIAYKDKLYRKIYNSKNISLFLLN